MSAKTHSLVSLANSAIGRSAVLLTAFSLGATAWILNSDRPAAGAEEAAVDPSTPVLATGTVLGGGTPKAGVTVSLLANPNQGALDQAGDAGMAMVPIAETVSAGDGSYRIWGSLDDLPADYRGSDGQVDVELVFDEGGSGTTWNYTLYPLGTTEPGVTVPVLEGDVASVAQDGSTGGNVLAPALAIDLGTTTVWAPGGETIDDATVGEPEEMMMRSTGFDPVALTSQPSGQVAQTETAALTEYASDYLGTDGGTQQQLAGRAAASAMAAPCITRWVDNWKRNKPERFVTTHGWRYAKATLRQGTSGSTIHTLGVAVVHPNDSLSASGSLSKSYSTGTTVTTSGLVDQIVYNRMNYRLKANTCGLGKWYPYSAYDFNTGKTATYNVHYHNCANKPDNTTWSTSTARNTTYDKGMDIGPISLKAQSGYGRSVDLSFRFTKPGKMCGNLSGGPIESSRVSAGPR